MVRVTDAAPGMWSVCVENGVLSKAALLVVLSNGVFCRECGAGEPEGECCAERFCAGQDGFFGGGWCAGGGTGEGWSCCWPWLRDRAAWGLPCGGARGSTWVFGAYERGSARLERNRSGVIVPLCEERGERIMSGRGAAAPGMSAGSIVAGGVISAGGAGGSGDGVVAPGIRSGRAGGGMLRRTFLCWAG